MCMLVRSQIGQMFGLELFKEFHDERTRESIFVRTTTEMSTIAKTNKSISLFLISTEEKVVSFCLRCYLRWYSVIRGEDRQTDILISSYCPSAGSARLVTIATRFPFCHQCASPAHREQDCI